MTEIVINLPTFHADQVRAYQAFRSNRFTVVRCGRRWGKTEIDKTLACHYALKGMSVGFFAPEYKYISETYSDIAMILAPIIAASSKTDGVIRTTTGGRIDFWSLENERAGRSRRYHLVIIDEAAFAKNSTMLGIWEKAIRPTLLDYGGKAIVTSNTNGVDPDNFIWQICNEPRHGFVDFHAPTHNNPFLPRDELAKLKDETHPLVYRQEYLAEFVDWSGEAFFALSKLLVGDEAVDYPHVCDGIVAVIDTATKTGRENDGTAVTWWAWSTQKYGPVGYSLVCLDWEYAQIEGSLLETWLPNVFRHGEDLARQCRARRGFLGAWIEDKSSGMVLLQHGTNKGWPTHAIESKLTSLGKVERAINVSGHVFREQVKLSRVAYDRTTAYKGVTRNHLVSQVVGFRVGSKESVDDDLLDSFTYAIAITLGNAAGF